MECAEAEMDRLCEALIAIHGEIQEIVDDRVPRDNNVLKNAPHTAEAVTATQWSRPYSREQPAFRVPWVRERKSWPAVGRIDDAYGDRNLVCTCPPMESYSALGDRLLSQTSPEKQPVPIFSLFFSLIEG
jgi:glycine dehydrogenase